PAWPNQSIRRKCWRHTPSPPTTPRKRVPGIATNSCLCSGPARSLVRTEHLRDGNMLALQRSEAIVWHLRARAGWWVLPQPDRHPPRLAPNSRLRHRIDRTTPRCLTFCCHRATVTFDELAAARRSRDDKALGGQSAA